MAEKNEQVEETADEVTPQDTPPTEDTPPAEDNTQPKKGGKLTASTKVRSASPGYYVGDFREKWKEDDSKKKS